MAESSLHSRAKYIFNFARSIVLPDLYAWQFEDHLEIETKYRTTQLTPNRISKNIPPDGLRYGVFSQTKVSVLSVKIEEPHFNIRPDVIIETSDGKIGIEIHVSGRVNQSKLKRIRELDFSVIEIDLSKYTESISDEELKLVILESEVGKSWLHISKLDWLFINVLSEIERVHRKFALGPNFSSYHIDYMVFGPNHPSLPPDWEDWASKEKRPVVKRVQIGNEPTYLVENCPIAWKEVNDRDIPLANCFHCEFHDQIAEDNSYIVCRKILWTFHK